MNGYTQKRRGAVEHLRDGRFTLLEYGAHDLILALADKATGIWWGSAKALAAICGAGDITDRQARHLLESLEKKRYVRRFPKRRGHGNYPVLVNKFEVTFGAYRGMRLNAEKSTDWRSPVYESCLEHGAAPGLEQGVARAPFREGEERQIQRKKPAAKPAPPADTRFQPFFQFAYESFTRKHDRKPIWQGKDRNGLKNLLKCQSAEALPLVRLQTLWQNYLNSTEFFTVKQGDSLAYFCSNIDKFSAGPLLAAPPRGIANGKCKDVNEAVATTMHGAAINAGITH
jgi:hypothetical protein